MLATFFIYLSINSEVSIRCYLVSNLEKAPLEPFLRFIFCDESIICKPGSGRFSLGK